MANTERQPGAGVDAQGNRWQLQQDGTWYSVDTKQTVTTQPVLNYDTSTWPQEYLDTSWSETVGSYTGGEIAKAPGCGTSSCGPGGAPGTGAPPAMTTPPSVSPPPDVGKPPAIGTPTVGTPPAVGTPPTVSAPTLPGQVQGPQVTPAPPYEKSPEQAAWEQMYGQQLQDWVNAGGYGIPQETQDLMAQRLTDTLKAREQEQLRVMRNDMARRGLDNSGFLFANEQKIRASTTEALANSVTDIKIQSELMRVASFERALGATGQFLGYLSDESAKAYAPKFATWEAQTRSDLMAWQAQAQADLEQWRMQTEQNYVAWQLGEQRQYQQWFLQEQAKLNAWEARVSQDMAVWQTNAQAKLAQWSYQTQQDFGAWQLKEELSFRGWATQQQIALSRWQVEMDLHKFNLAQAYTQQNMMLEEQIRERLAISQHERDKELMQIQVEAANQQAGMMGAGQLLGTLFMLPFMK